MKMITCIIRPEQLGVVTDALLKLNVLGGTLTDVRGFGRQKGQVEHYRGEEYTIRFMEKVKMDLVVHDDDVEKVVGTVAESARTGKVGDGKIFVAEVPNAVRIRTGEKGPNAL